MGCLEKRSEYELHVSPAASGAETEEAGAHLGPDFREGAREIRA